jgi:hypothetical protein
VTSLAGFEERALGGHSGGGLWVSNLYFTFKGQRSETAAIAEILRAAGFDVEESEGKFGFRSTNRGDYLSALRYLWENRRGAWAKQRVALIRNGICTADEFSAATTSKTESLEGK